MQAALNPALAQVIGAMDVISPVTPDGKPTVAAQVMQAAKQATMPQIAQQAGLGGQIQAMRAQQAQQALMQQAMQQRPEAVGIAPMAGPVQMAEGGIVGYAPGGLGEDDMESFVNPEFGGSGDVDRGEPRLRVPGPRGERMMTPAEMRAENYPEDYILRRMEIEGLISREPRAPAARPAPSAAAEVPVAQPSRSTESSAPPVSRAPAAPAAPKAQAPAPMTSTGLFDRAQGRLDQYATEPVTPRSAIQPALEAGAASDEYRRQMGLPTEMERIAQQEAQFKSLFGDREKLIQRRLAEIEGQRQMGGIAAFMKGFRQMKGEPIGPGVVRASDSMGFYDTTMRQRTEKLEDLKIELQGLSIERQNALDKMRDDIANGRFSDALKRKDAAQKATNEILLKRAEIDMAQAKVVGGVEEARIRQMQQPGEIERLLGRLETLRRTDPTAAEKLIEDIATIRGAGRKPSGPEARQRMLEQYADNWEKMDLMEKKQLVEQGIKTYEDYVKYRDRIAGVAPTTPTGGASSDLLKRADAIVGGR